MLSCQDDDRHRRTAQPRAQRRPRADGERTRGAILRAAASLATVDGLEGLSIGNLAAAIGMSKSGLYAHFGSKQELQLATVEEAGRIFAGRSRAARPRGPARPGPAGGGVRGVLRAPAAPHLPRRLLLRRRGAGDGHPPRAGQGTRSPPSRPGSWTLLRGFAATAIEQHELPAREDPDRLAFELNGIILAADTNFVLHDDPAVLDLARQVVHRRLGSGTATSR